MTRDLDEVLQTYADDLDRSAAPIELDEIVGRSAQPLPPRRSTNLRIWLIAAAAIVIVGAGIVAIAWEPREAIRTTPSVDTPSTIATTINDTINTSVAATTPTTAAATTATTATIPASTNPPTTSFPVPAPLTVESVREQQVAALRTLPGFSATATTDIETLPGEPPQEGFNPTFTLLADGSFWADLGPGMWGSWDPMTGIVRGAFTGFDGQIAYQEIVGQADNSLAAGILIGYNPGTPIEVFPDGEQTVVEVTVDGRPAWEVTTTFEFSPGLPGDPSDGVAVQTTRNVIDQATGLIVEQALTNNDPENLGSARTSRLSDVQVADEMPPEFPGSFPADAVVDRSGDPSLAPVSAIELRSQLGPSVPLPAELDDVRLNYWRDDLSFGNGIDPAPIIGHTVTISYPMGFVPTVVQLQYWTVAPGASLPDGWLSLADGRTCSSFDGLACDAPDTENPVPEATVVDITNGAFAGGRALAYVDQTSVFYDGYSVIVRGAGPAQTTDILSSFAR